MVYGSFMTHIARIPFAGWVNEMHFVHGKRLLWALTYVAPSPPRRAHAHIAVPAPHAARLWASMHKL